MTEYRNPKPTVDIVIFMKTPWFFSLAANTEILLIKRKNPPYGWALPGGFVNEYESLSYAAQREASEETGLIVDLEEQFHTYSDPVRDPRQHNMSTVFLAKRAFELQRPKAADDATEIKVVTLKEALTMDLAFDHRAILEDVQRFIRTGNRPAAST